MSRIPFFSVSTKSKVAFLPVSLNGWPYINYQKYDFANQGINEVLEAKSISAWAVRNFFEDSEYKIIFFIKSKDSSGHKNISDIGSSLSGISEEGEHGMKLSNMVRTE